MAPSARSLLQRPRDDHARRVGARRARARPLQRRRQPRVRVRQRVQHDDGDVVAQAARLERQVHLRRAVGM